MIAYYILLWPRFLNLKILIYYGEMESVQWLVVGPVYSEDSNYQFELANNFYNFISYFLKNWVKLKEGALLNLPL